MKHNNPHNYYFSNATIKDANGKLCLVGVHIKEYVKSVVDKHSNNIKLKEAHNIAISIHESVFESISQSYLEDNDSHDNVYEMYSRFDQRLQDMIRNQVLMQCGLIEDNDPLNKIAKALAEQLNACQ